MTTGLQGWLMAGAGAATAGAVTVGALLLWPAPTRHDPVSPLEQTQKPGAEAVKAAAKPEVTPEVKAAEEPPGPKFDHVRIEADGSAVIAGRAAPRARVQLVVDAKVLAETEAGPDGQFALLTNLPLSDAPQQLELVAEGEGARKTAMLMVEPLSSAPAASGGEGAASGQAEPEAGVEAAPDEIAASGDVGLVLTEGGEGAEALPPGSETGAGDVAGTSAPAEDLAEVAPEEITKVAKAAAEQMDSALPVEEMATLADATPGEADLSRDVPLVGGDLTAGTPAGGEQVAAPLADAAPRAAAEGPGAEAAQPGEEALSAPLTPEAAQAKPTSLAQLEAPVGAGEARVAPADPAPKVAVGGSQPLGLSPDPKAGVELAAASETTPSSGAAPAAPRVVVADDEGVRVLQSGEPPEVQAQQVALDSISYAPDGAVILAGRGAADRFVRVYVDNSEIVTAAIGRDGQWRTDLPSVDKGVYTLRVDELDAAGAVTSRTETPFQREDAAAIAAEFAAATETPEKPVTVVVQPGNTLWGIARGAYGKGILYVRVFEANKGRIRNPHLIYPGQVFDMPVVDR